MEIIELKVEKQLLTVTQPKELSAGTNGLYGVTVTFDDEWEDIDTKMVTFIGPKSIITVLYEGEAVTIPWEALQEPGQLMFGVYGIGADGIRKNTTYATQNKVTIHPATTTPTGPSPVPEPTPDIWTDIQRQIGNLSQLATQNKDNLVAAINEIYGSLGYIDFNHLVNRPKYAGQRMTGETNIPSVPQAVAAEAQARQQAINELAQEIAGDIDEEAELREAADRQLDQAKVDKVAGKGLSANDYTNTDKEAVAEIPQIQQNVDTLFDTTAEHDRDIQGLGNDVDDLETRATAIEGKIPAQATTENQLADKAFVNSTVQTGTANFRGNWLNWASVPMNADEYPADYTGETTPSTNDYMVVQDASGYVDPTTTLAGTWRFKYSGVWATDGRNGWHPEYQVNETPMTAAQLAALNSGITEEKVAQIDQNKEDITDLGTKKVGFEDYATSSTGGVIKAYAGSAFAVNGNGIPSASSKTYTEYESAGNGMFVGKATLENVITGKEIKGSPLVDIGTAQFTYNSTVLPMLTAAQAREIYAAYIAGKHCTLKWTLYGTENYLNVLSADLIAGTYSIDVCVHNQYHVAYSWTASTTGNVTATVSGTEHKVLSQAEYDALTTYDDNTLYLIY